MNENELLPCPFCGGSARLFYNPPGRFVTEYFSVVHICPGHVTINCCGKTAEEAARYWNMRAVGDAGPYGDAGGKPPAHGEAEV